MAVIERCGICLATWVDALVGSRAVNHWLAGTVVLRRVMLEIALLARALVGRDACTAITIAKSLVIQEANAKM